MDQYIKVSAFDRELWELESELSAMTMTVAALHEQMRMATARAAALKGGPKLLGPLQLLRNTVTRLSEYAAFMEQDARFTKQLHEEPQLKFDPAYEKVTAFSGLYDMSPVQPMEVPLQELQARLAQRKLQQLQGGDAEQRAKLQKVGVLGSEEEADPPGTFYFEHWAERRFTKNETSRRAPLRSKSAVITRLGTNTPVASAKGLGWCVRHHTGYTGYCKDCHPEGDPEVKGVCAYCGKAAQGNYAIHINQQLDDPQVDLCDACGGCDETVLSCEQIWEKFARYGVCK